MVLENLIYKKKENIMEILLKEKEMEMECKFGMMVVSIKVNLKMI